MIDLIERNRDRIAAACRRHAVKRLELFGSAARGDDFTPGESDVDFFVEFQDYDAPTIADQWFGLQEDLATVLGHAVDLTSTRMATDPYFLVVANKYRTEIYAA